MALSIQDSRILLKRSTVTSEAPTAAPSNDFTDGTWSSLDIYIGETFANTVDEKLWHRFTNNIRQIAVADSPTTNRLTYWNASGHLGNIAAPTDGYYLKYTNASGYIWAAAGGAESQTWNDVLMLGNASDGTNPLISAGDAIEWNNSDASFKTYLTNDQATAANRTVYLPKFGGQLAYHATGVPLVSGRVTYATTNGALTDTSLFTFDGSKLGVGIATATATIHAKGSTSDSTAYALKVDNSSSSALLYVRNDGNIGMGIAAAAVKLHLYKNDNSILAQVINNESTGNAARTGLAFWSGASGADGTMTMQKLSSTYATTIAGITSIAGYGYIYSASSSGVEGSGGLLLGGSPVTTFVNAGGFYTKLDANGLRISAAANINNANAANGLTVEGNSYFGNNTAATERVDVLGNVNVSGVYKVGGVSGVTQTGAYTNFTIVGGIITAAS